MNRQGKEAQNTIPLPIPADLAEAYPQSVLSSTLKECLQTKVAHHAIIIPARLTAKLRVSLSSLLMKRPKLKDVYSLVVPDDVMEGVNPRSERKLVLASVVGENDSIYSHELIKPLLENKDNDDNNDDDDDDVEKKLCKNIRKSTHEVVIGYDHYTVEQVLSKILPPSLCKEIPSSFEVVGMIAHLNLREDYLPFKYIIGKVIVEKNKSIQVCVNKVGTIQNEFRTFPMEIIADDRANNKSKKKSKTNNNGKHQSMNGDQNKNDGALLEVEVKEDGCKFKLDFEKVYWNSRLQYEHRRIVHLIGGKSRPTNVNQRQKRNETQGTSTSPTSSSSAKTSKENEIIVADACAGIGPFAVPLTSQYSHVTVYANDLNPVSYKYLTINSQTNKCKNLHTYNMDARYFLRKLDEEGIKYHHVLMNLPAIAPEFLNVFRGWKRNGVDATNSAGRPWIHVHCFGGKGDGADEEAMARCSRSLGCTLDKVKDEVSIHIVRDVSPKKNMLCVSFRLPEGVESLVRIDEFGPVTAVDEEGDKNGDEPEAKRARTNSK